MLLQPQDVNALLHNMRQQILALTTQLAELQANPPAATPSVEKKFNKKVEVIADPGAFEGDRAQFAKWWIKLQIWVKANWDAFANNFEGPVAGRYAQVRMQECYTAGVWHTWDNLKVEIEKYFKPQVKRDWAHQQICSFKQGNMRMDDFVTRFLALSIQGGLGNEHAVELLECNVNPHIAEQLYLQDMRNENLSEAAEVRKIGRAIELYKMHQGGRSTTKNNFSQRHPGSSNQNNITLMGSSRLGCNQVGVLQWILVRSRADKSADSPASTVGRRGTWHKIVEMERRPLNKKIIKGARRAN
ncbi:hypothetical protein SERLA73DRAFT_79874 [Serpula lacrymans var. lacrymans S7.3]|uniref:Retrotransposon gag domain-containing protein n=2 Tax=Serpula lacrymans var. lacrymans TaxID=341189 RepID=F8QHW4_SERL3|nr:uncharacterized protein SERLADRAFT_444154 [Serpula lacrymans var. lacrymans S7.9]EGN92111.1 hypothetical protein SERLA73DRAFT_79874 [Serpula lacrymans var. lacrymans S7.3]EGO18409.1 hypothetical protein SERLADRAFT_444154 [Serpula lacrymans var. lacrymans S7.9]